MTKQIYRKFDKDKLNSLPKAEASGRIITIITEGEAERAVNFLLAQNILGIDTETRPAFKRGAAYKVALLQVACEKICFLFRLNIIGLTPAIIRLLEDTSVPKVGLSLHDDILMLSKRKTFNPGSFYDLQKHVKEIGIEDLALQKIYANLFGKKISKAQRLSNWEAPILSDAQKKYAAFDAWSCIEIYQEINRLKQTHDYELVEVEAEAGNND
ncbi:MAG: 3'-5' exonuclease domain-containing protein 2 [Bacteroidaceae bacterium]|nr:3'-5' exonuclease domain-containing protein 2 [Bacteroidaceae bacterium]